MDELSGGGEFGAAPKRPLLMAAGLIAIAALGLSGLYQGFRLTWRPYGPAPSYAQLATAATQAAQQTIPRSPPPTTDARDSGPTDAGDPANAAETTAPIPTTPVQVATDDPQSSPAATAAGGPANASVQPAAYSPPGSQAPAQPAPASDPSAASPADIGPGPSPAQTPQ